MFGCKGHGPDSSNSICQFFSDFAVRRRQSDSGQEAAASFFDVLPPCPRNVRVGANSPSLWPTISSVTYTLRWVRPLWTRNVKPMNSGVMVDRRDQVLIGSF